jgi:peptidoglycan/LPS O-acetylase OafA/YrhL
LIVPVAVITSIAICGAVLCYQPRIVIGFRHAWFPLWENAVYYAVPFTLGWCWHVRKDHTFPPWLWAAGIAAGTAVFIAMLPGLRQHLSDEHVPARDLLVPVLFAAFGILMSVSLFAGALSAGCERPPASVRYLAQASFWVYLLHHPLVGLAHVDLALTEWPPVVEFLASASVATLLSLLTYEAAVRRSAIGRLLNGGRDLRKEKSRPADQSRPPGQPRRRAA